MKKLNQIADASVFEQAIADAEKTAKQRTARTNELSNKSYANSLIFSKRKQAVSETATIDIALALLSSCTNKFHLSQVLELLKIGDCTRKSVAAHVRAKSEFDSLLSVDSNNVFTVENKEFFAHLVHMSEFKQQVHKHFSKFYSLLECEQIDFEQAHILNVYDAAHEMNAAYNAAKTKKDKTQAIS